MHPAAATEGHGINLVVSSSRRVATYSVSPHHSRFRANSACTRYDRSLMDCVCRRVSRQALLPAAPSDARPAFVLLRKHLLPEGFGIPATLPFAHRCYGLAPDGLCRRLRCYDR